MQKTTCRSALRFALGGAIAALLIASPQTANARWLEKAPPAYPAGVFYQGLQGSVVLSMTLDHRGRVTGASVLRTSGHPELDELARNAAMKWRLSPDSVLPSDVSQGRVELITFVNPPPPAKMLLPGSLPYWAQLR